MHWEKKWFQFSILMLLAFIWGSSFILMKTGLESFDDIQAASLRIGFAALFLLPYSIKCIMKLKRKDLKPLLMAGFLGNLIPAFLFAKAQTQIDSALAGMLNSLTPVFTLIIGLLLFHTTIKRSQIIGIALGLLGALCLIVLGSGNAIGDINNYAFLIVLATICYAININVVKTYLSHLRGVQITALSFFFIGPLATFSFFASDFQQSFQADGWLLSLSALAFLGVLGTAIAMLLMNTLIQYTSAVFASSVTYIIPIFAIGWGVLDGELITAWHLGCMGLILLGVYLINRKKRKAA